MAVEEANRAWTSSNAANDHQAVTIEVANDGGAPDWHVSDKVLAKLVDLCVDICKRNGIKALNYTGDASGNLTRHNMFAATGCPGSYLQSKFPYIAAEVNKRLGVPVKPAPPTPAKPVPTSTIKVGCKVMVVGTHYSTGSTIPAWAKNSPHLVSRINGDKALLGAGSGINSWVNIKDLQPV
jgi:hypothetical protein